MGLCGLLSRLVWARCMNMHNVVELNKTAFNDAFDIFLLTIGPKKLFSDTVIGYRNVQAIRQAQHCFTRAIHIQILNVVDIDDIGFLYPVELCGIFKMAIQKHLQIFRHFNGATIIQFHIGIRTIGLERTNVIGLQPVNLIFGKQQNSFFHLHLGLD